MGWTRFLRGLLAVLAFVFTTLASLLFFAQDRFLDADDFGETVAGTLSEPALG